MLKLSRLLKLSVPSRKANSTLVKVVGYKEGRDKKGFAVAMAKTYSDQIYSDGRRKPAKDKTKYVSKVTFVDAKLNVHVSCSCPDYVFAGWEYANAQKGAGKILFGNGEAPTEKNPNNRPGLCKHLIKLSALIIERHPKINL